MADSITRTTYQGPFSRLTGSLVGVLIGICMVPGSVVLVSWNEYRTVHRSRGLSEAETVVAEAPDAFEVDSTLNDRLIHTSGTATTDQTLLDSEFSVEQKVLRLERQVEMYQWVEEKNTKTRDKIGGGKETITTYTYQKKWHEGRVNSGSFEEKAGHENPAPKFAALSQVSDQVKLGALHLQPALIERRLHDWQDLSVDLNQALAKFDDATRQHFRPEGNGLYYSQKVGGSSDPQVGDQRIRFRVVEPQVVSVLAKKERDELVPFKTSNGESIEHLMVGKVSTAEMFDSLKMENTVQAWILRAVGWLLCCVGFVLIANPIKTLAGIIPPLGWLVGTMTFFVAVLLGSIVTLSSIAFAWIAVRPVFGISLLVLAAGAVYLLMRRSKSTRASSSVSEPPPLPPPLPNG